MGMKGYDVFYTEPDTVDEMFCKVCGTRCDVKRNVYGATGMAESMARRGHLHDTFRCPYSGKPWHEEALELVERIEETPSKRVVELMRQDLDDMLRENGCGPLRIENEQDPQDDLN